MSGGATAASQFDQNDSTTVVITSCGRYDLLQQTLDSFFAYNSFPVDQIIVVEDGRGIPDAVTSKYASQPMEWIATGKRVGQIAAIDYAYSRVETPYIFHAEDDWEFCRPGFIEKSLVLLEHHPTCLQVWIRGIHDTQYHPVEPGTFYDRGVSWQRMALDFDLNGEMWHGFTFNPGLRRLQDYIALGGYGKHTKYDFGTPWRSEATIGKLYRSMGFHAEILSDDDGAGYVRHLGRGRRVAPPDSG